MKIIVDGREDQIKVTLGTSLGALIDEIKVFLTRRGRSVTTFTLDGQPLTSADQNQLTERLVDDFSVLAVTTVDPRELSVSLLTQFHDLLGKIEGGYGKAAEDLTAGKVQGSLEWLHRSFENWNVILYGIRDIMRLFTINGNTTMVDGVSMTDMVAQLNKTLTTFRRAFASNDVVAISDLSEYELKPLIPRWTRLMEVLKSMVEKTS